MMGLFDGMTQVQGKGSDLDKEVAQLVSSLMTTSDMEIKSEIKNPLNLTRLKEFGRWCTMEKMDGCEEIIDEFIMNYLKYMVSHNREGRTEVVRAISEMVKKMHHGLLGDREVEQ
jgi:hypothetical protein